MNVVKRGIVSQTVSIFVRFQNCTKNETVTEFNCELIKLAKRKCLAEINSVMNKQLEWKNDA